MNTSVHNGTASFETGSLRALRPRVSRPSLLEVAAEVLVAHPTASLATVAEAAGIGRTTLHKHYPTRDALVRAVALRALDACAQAAAEAGQVRPRQAQIGCLLERLVPIAPQLEFFWRNPRLDGDESLYGRWQDVEKAIADLVRGAQELGVLRRELSEWWLMNAVFALVYVAGQQVAGGRLAPLDAPSLILDTLGGSIADRGLAVERSRS